MTLSAPPAASAAAVSAAAAACGPPSVRAGRATAASAAAPGRYFHSPSVHSSSAPGPAGAKVTTSGLGVAVRAEPAGDRVGPGGGDGRIQRAGRGGGLRGVVVGEQPCGLGAARLREPVGPAVAHPADGERARRRVVPAPHTSVHDGGDGVPRGTSAPAAAAAAATALRVHCSPPVARSRTSRAASAAARAASSDDRVDDTPSQTTAATQPDRLGAAQRHRVLVAERGRARGR